MLDGITSLPLNRLVYSDGDRSYRPFPFGVVERLLGIEQITLLDSQSFRGKASKRRHERQRKESEEKRGGGGRIHS